jgi:hypothetical protein
MTCPEGLALFEDPDGNSIALAQALDNLVAH